MNYGQEDTDPNDWPWPLRWFGYVMLVLCGVTVVLGGIVAVNATINSIWS